MKRWDTMRSIDRCVIISLSLASLLVADPVWGETLSNGSNVSGQPGVVRTLSGLPSVAGSWQIVANGSYGWRPNVHAEGGGDSLHNNWGRLALSYAPWTFFQIALSLDQRVDLYNGPGQTGGLVSGSVGDPWISLRTGWDLGSGFSLAGHLGILFPSGVGAFSAVGNAISPVIDLSVSFTPERVPIGVHLQLGYHHLRSGELISGVEGFSSASLLLSDITVSKQHLALALAIEYRIRFAAPYVEVVGDIPFDNDGLDHIQLLVGFGSRFWLGPHDAVQLTLTMEVGALSGNPSPAPIRLPDRTENEVWSSTPLVNALLGVAVRLPIRRDETVETETDSSDTPAVGGETPSPGTGRIAGRVLCGEAPCGRGTTVEVSGTGGSPFAVDTEQGTFTTTELPPGTYRVVATTEGFEPASQEVVVTDGATAAINVSLEAVETVATGIRGRVTDFNGEPVQSRVRIPDLDIEIQTDEAGLFEVEAPVGTYQVMIWAQGYQTQTSTQEVTARGMVIMNVELRGRRRR